jgi:hypothetical protein
LKNCGYFIGRSVRSSSGDKIIVGFTIVDFGFTICYFGFRIADVGFKEIF